MARAEVEALRAQVRQQRKRATAKAGRLRREQRAHVAGTKFDPRRNVGAESRMNERQLRAYLGRLQGFNKRSTQFVGGVAGAPLPRAKVNAFLQAQSNFNETRKNLRDRINPESESAKRMNKRHGKSLATDNILGMSRLDPRNITSAKNLEKATDLLRRRMSGAGTRSDIDRARKALKTMATTHDLAKIVGEFTDDEVALAFSDNTFMNALTLIHYSDKEDVVEQQKEAIGPLIKDIRSAVE